MATAHDTPGGGTPIRKAEVYAAVRDWPGYFRVVLGKPPRETLLAALESFEREGLGPERQAVDLGCGEGRDTFELLRRGWSVIALDGHPDAFKHLRAQLPAGFADRLQTRLCPFAAAEWPPVHLVNSSFSLPFCEPEHFAALWGRIVGSLWPGGRFAGQLFGDRDTWAALPDRSHQTRAEVDALFRGFEIEYWQEEEREGNDAEGFSKHWHVYHIVARKT